PGDTRALNAQAGASGCDAPRAAGSIIVPQERGDPTAFKVAVGGKTTTAEVDPSMAFFTLTNVDARRLGLQGVTEAPVVSIMLAGSVVTAHLVRVEQLVLAASRGGKGTITARDVDVAVVDVAEDGLFAPRLGHNVLDLETTGDDAAVTWRAWTPAPGVEPLPG
ncbi:MAG: aspartyl protease family protein, partial [Flavobacteriales bacterium]|nr:aspartyl protease family protein [Flavobacteriales bacterium]